MVANKIKYGIGFKLVLFIGIVFVCLLMAIGIFNYTKSKQAMQENMEFLSSLALKNVEKVFNAEISTQKTALENLAQQISASALSDEQIVLLLKNFQEILQVDLVYVGFEKDGKNIRSNGKILGENEGYDSRTRGWYKQAKEKKGFLLNPTLQGF